MTHMLSMTRPAADISALPAALFQTSVPALPAPICPPPPDTTLVPGPESDELEQDLPEDAPGDLGEGVQDDPVTLELARSDRFMQAQGFEWHDEGRTRFWYHAQTDVQVCRDPDQTNDEWTDAKIYGLIRSLLIQGGKAGPAMRHPATPQHLPRTDLVVQT